VELREVAQADIKKCCPLDGVRVTEMRAKDAYTTTSITMEDASGHVMVIQGGSYSNDLDVFVKAPPRKVKKYRLTGELFTGSLGLEVKIDETFDDHMDAVARKQGLEQHGGTFAIAEVEVEAPEE